MISLFVLVPVLLIINQLFALSGLYLSRICIFRIGKSKVQKTPQLPDPFMNTFFFWPDSRPLFLSSCSPMDRSYLYELALMA